jgi:2-hydroxy-6-oxonona-2,4-dienedioate hydrolase
MHTRPTQPIEIAQSQRHAREITLRGLGQRDVAAKVETMGEGRPVVFLHGLAGLNDHWEDTVQLAHANFRCVMLEIPLLELEGDDCSIDGVAALTQDFLSRHLDDRAVLVGNSFGGHVALRLAIEHPRLVRGLVLAGSSGLNERTMVAEVRLRPTREWMSRKIGELFFDKSKMREADVDRAFAELGERRRARAMVRLSRSARRNHLGDEIGRITAPTLIVWGREDVVTPPDAAHEFNAKIRDSSIVWYDRCGHAPMLEWPDLFADSVSAFVRDLAARGL